jgi:hypothetical protein
MLIITTITVLISRGKAMTRIIILGSQGRV